ncbi:MAG: c-type cytochrome [Chitinophagales bacterium]|nr:c-type cytochrome [Chitinophagales bacterium]
MRKPYLKNILTASALLVGLVAQAQDAATTAAPAVSSTSATENTLIYLLVSASAVLLLAVLLLGNVLVKLTAMAIDKRAAKTIAVLLFIFSVGIASAQGTAPVTGDKPYELPFRYDVLVGGAVLGMELMVVFWLLIRINALVAEISDEKKKAFSFNIHMPLIFDKLNASVAIEKEKDILLDHNYDGIHELDNNLPPWWKYSFYLSIIWAFGYIGYYYFGGGPTSHDEYIAEVQQAKIDVDAFNKKNALNVDESNVKLADAAGILDGQDIYKSNCAACHGNAGEGNVGPNLTDDYWIHGATLNDVFKTVKYGWPAKGMKSWESDLSGVQIKNVVSYIHSLHGTNPANAKAPQGDLFKEGAVTASDSTMLQPADSNAVAVADTLKK